jgi:hypothetical protein
MIADVEETKRRWQDASQTVRAESLTAVAEARAAFSEALIKLEHAIEERLAGYDSWLMRRTARASIRLSKTE